MTISTGRDLHIDQHLTNLAINYRPQAFIADMIAPIVPVEKQSNAYPVFSRFEAFAVEDTTRGPGQEARKITRSVSSGQYYAKNYALGYDVAIEDVVNMDAALRYELDAGATRYLMGKLGIDYEKRVLTLAANTASVGSVFVPNSAWTGAGVNGGDCVSQIFQMIEQVQNTTGQRPNKILMGWKAWNYARRNYYLRNMLNGLNNGGGTVTRQQMANLFEVDDFLVSEAMWHNANEAAVNSGVLGNVLDSSVLTYYAPSAPSRDDPSWMYSFRWQAPGLPTPMVVERHPYDTKKKVDTIEAGYYQDEKIVGPEYAARMLVTVASGALGLV